MSNEHHPHAPRRTAHSHVDVPTRPISPRQKRVAMAAGVGVTMFVILGLYAASFRHNVLFREARQASPRWSLIEGNIIDGVRPYQPEIDGLGAIKGAVVSMVKTKIVQTRGIEIMKAKIQSASATAALKN